MVERYGVYTMDEGILPDGGSTQWEAACQFSYGLDEEPGVVANGCLDGFGIGGASGEGNMQQGQFYGDTAGDMRGAFQNGLFPAVGDEERQVRRYEDSKRRLAKRANEIYRSLCEELALKQCFFYGFNAWSDFVDGKMSENAFYEMARAEAQDIASRNN